MAVLFVFLQIGRL
uniref:Uncharacterized protein n=1 Tax=Rhizophora mucronata TaxID=61149 RepID=A0A2P2ND16_RHIMU